MLISNLRIDSISLIFEYQMLPLLPPPRHSDSTLPLLLFPPTSNSPHPPDQQSPKRRLSLPQLIFPYPSPHVLVFLVQTLCLPLLNDFLLPHGAELAWLPLSACVSKFSFLLSMESSAAPYFIYCSIASGEMQSYMILLVLLYICIMVYLYREELEVLFVHQSYLALSVGI